MKHALRLALGVLAVGLTAATSGQNTALREQARTALSQTQGTIALPGLDGPVDVIRDTWGVPHIYATSEHDLFFAQGFVAAQDRLWQLDLWRRIAEGQLSAILGPAGIKRDTFARLLRYRGDWDAEWSGYGPRARQIVEAFVAGINAQIDIASLRAETLPIEFQMTASRPGRWTPQTVVGRMAGYVMTRNGRTEVQRARLVARLGAERAAALMPTNPPVVLAVPEGLDLADITENILDITTGTSESVDFSPLRPPASDRSPGLALAGPLVVPPAPVSALLAPPDPAEIGSNDWVVSGKLTASGKPLLANDPHRALMLPSLRYTVHLTAPGWNVIGAGEPALPGIAAGHNDRVAFGFTIVGIDQQDLYVERLDPGDANRYQYKGAWETMRVERETLRVKGEPDREIELRFTRHGPVLHVDAARHRAYALRWVGSEPGTAGYLRALMLDRARNVDDIRAAIAGWKVPSENIVYADVDGNIGWVAAGLAPVRKNWDGLLPVPGDTGQYEWDGFLKAEQLPQIANPRNGFIATANHNILPRGYAQRLGYEFGAPWRFERILALLGARGLSFARPNGVTLHLDSAQPRFTAADFARMQHDELSLQASAIAWALAQALREPHATLDEPGTQAARILAGWDGVLAKDSAAAALYETWLPLLGNGLGRVVLTDADRAAGGARLSGDRIVDYIRMAGWTPEPARTPWVDGTEGLSPGNAPDKTRVQAVRAKVIEALTGPALGDAWREMVKRQGTDPTRWSWGAVHHAAFEHALAFTPERQALLNLPTVPRGGDATTVNATSGGARQTAGASYRQIIDLSNWENSVTVNVPGESGQPGSEHYGDLLPLWATGRYHPMLFLRSSVEHAASARLRLDPPPR
jgi:penicillin G amidase